MRKLPPIVSGVKGQMLQLEELSDVDFEFLGYLLSCHLVIEHHLDEFIATLGTRLRWSKARITFAQKVALFPEDIFPNGGEFKDALSHINSLRNKVAHNIHARASDMNLEPFCTLLKAAESENDSLPEDPIEILEAFTLVACSGLIGWVASDAYRTTWRHERKK